MAKAIIFVILWHLLFPGRISAGYRDTIDLSGQWHYRLSGAPSQIPGEGVILLPNTLDNARKSIYQPESDNTDQLRREYSFTGEASYSKRIIIPNSWEDKEIELFIERTKPSEIYIDGEQVATSSRISSPQRYNLTDFLKPGNHLIEIKVNNADSLPPAVRRSSHAVSESTQTNWNGILGKFYLESINKQHIKNVKLREELSKGEIIITVRLSNPADSALRIFASLNGGKGVTAMPSPGSEEVELVFPLDEDIPLWSAIFPTLANLNVNLEEIGKGVIDEYNITTGFRDFKSENEGFTINGRPEFLRGTVNAAVFPLTGYAPTDLESWLRYFRILKEYGINHVRFHSWTPPEAAFTAADIIGIYIQTELPIWGELDRDMTFHDRFLKEELIGIIESFSHHPSFMMFSTGNELWGDISLMGEYMNKAREENPRILSTYGSNVYLGMNGKIGEEDFIVASKTDDDVENSVRGSVSFADSSTGGFFNSVYPENHSNYNNATRDIESPVIAHEVGQYQIYPDFSQIEKYTGELKSDNLKEFQQRARESGLEDRNKAYAKASGKWAVTLYKAEMEKLQRSHGIAGYQLFGLQDYPGQGGAFIGILDSFMDSKGITSPSEWRQSSNDILLLAELPRYTFFEGETLEIPLKTANYTSKADTLTLIKWSLDSQTNEIPLLPGTGLIPRDSIKLTLPAVDSPKKLELNLYSNLENVSNSYDLWIYPQKKEEVKNIIVTTDIDEALKYLKKGERVILSPDSAISARATLPPLFVNDFWNYRMFKTICDEMGMTPSPGTLGLYINADHPAFKKFPTEDHTDWQWFSIVKNSRPLIIDRLPGEVRPIVEVIDNVDRSYRLSLLLECKIGKGRLILFSGDIGQTLDYPEVQWFLQSLKEYMAGKEFNPEITLTPEQLINLITKPSLMKQVKELKNEN